MDVVARSLFSEGRLNWNATLKQHWHLIILKITNTLIGKWYFDFISMYLNTSYVLFSPCAVRYGYT